MNEPNAQYLIALDWGSSALRAYLFNAQGVLLQQRVAPLGILQIQQNQFDAALQSMCGEWKKSHPDAHMIASGMIGSRQGWLEVPYLTCPATLQDLKQHGLSMKFSVKTSLGLLHIVPGLSCLNAQNHPDVMRGEETQIVGAMTLLAQKLHTKNNILFVLPGTHSKWAHIKRDERNVRTFVVQNFSTFMTGELFALLMQHSILAKLAAPLLENAPVDEFSQRAFEQGVRVSLQSSDALLHRLFSARTLVLFEQLNAQEVADYVSGLLIGNEIQAARVLLSPTQPSQLVLIGEAALRARYAHALALAQWEGMSVTQAPEHCAAHGLWALACVD